MPPTWIVLVSFHALDPTLNPIVLAAVGATGAMIGRFVLLKATSYFSRFMGTERRSSLDKIQNYLQSKRLGYFATSLVFAATPLPDNILFITYGLMKAKGAQIYCGFWVGRFAAYLAMLSVSEIVLTPFMQMFEERYMGVLVMDVGSVLMMVVFASVNWNVLISEKKLRFVKPKFWRM